MAEKGNSPCPLPVHPHGRHRIFSPPPEGTAPTVPFHGRCFAQRTKAKALLSLHPTLTSERIRILHEYYWRGAEDSDPIARLLLHIMASVYVSCSTQCPGTPTWRDECGSVHY